MKKIPYIRDTKKEIHAINSFMMEGEKPETIMMLVDKLIAIKQNPKYTSDKFWVGCAINIYCLMAYRVQIETVYLSLFPQEIKNEPEQKEVPMEIKKDWTSFLKWSEKNLTISTRTKLPPLFQKIEKGIIYLTDPDDTTIKNLIQVYFENSGNTIEYRLESKVNISIKHHTPESAA